MRRRRKYSYLAKVLVVIAIRSVFPRGKGIFPRLNIDDRLTAGGYVLGSQKHDTKGENTEKADQDSE